jgi:hypothetical protein
MTSWRNHVVLAAFAVLLLAVEHRAEHRRYGLSAVAEALPRSRNARMRVRDPTDEDGIRARAVRRSSGQRVMSSQQDGLEARNDGVESVRTARWRIRHRSCG